MAEFECANSQTCYFVPTKFIFDWKIDASYIDGNKQIKTLEVIGPKNSEFSVEFLQADRKVNLICVSPKCDITVKGEIVIEEHKKSSVVSRRFKIAFTKTKRKGNMEKFEDQVDGDIKIYCEFLAYEQKSKYYKYKYGSKNFREILQDYWKNNPPHLTDYKIKFSDDEVPCHKIIILARSEYMRYNQQQNDQLINLDEFTSEISDSTIKSNAVKGLLGYIYTGDPYALIEDNSLDVVKEIIKLGKNLQVKGIEYLFDKRHLETFNQFVFKWIVNVSILDDPSHPKEIKSIKFMYQSDEFVIKIKNKPEQDSQETIGASKEKTSSNKKNEGCNEEKEVQEDSKDGLSSENSNSQESLTDTMETDTPSDVDSTNSLYFYLEKVKKGNIIVSGNIILQDFNERELENFYFNSNEKIIYLGSLNTNKLPSSTILKCCIFIANNIAKIETSDGIRFAFDKLHFDWISNDFRKLYKNKTNTDLLLEIKREGDSREDDEDKRYVSFDVHKIILSARSPKLKCLIDESANNKIEIQVESSIVYKIFDKIVRYIYTDEFEFNLTEDEIIQFNLTKDESKFQLSIDIYTFSNKYDIICLAQKSRDFLLKEKLRQNTANNIMLTAKQFKGEYLQKEVENYMNKKHGQFWYKSSMMFEEKRETNVVEKEKMQISEDVEEEKMQISEDVEKNDFNLKNNKKIFPLKTMIYGYKYNSVKIQNNRITFVRHRE